MQPEDESTARSYVDLLRQGKFDQIQQDLDPSIADASVHETLVKMSQMIPAETPTTVKVVGAHTFHGPLDSTSNLNFEYEYPSKWLLINVAIKRSGETRTIVGFHVNPISDSLEHANRFTFEGKGLVQYSAFFGALALSAFNLYAFVVCLRTPNLKGKWLWSIFVLLGVGRLAVNWTTGSWTVLPVSVNAPCGNAFAELYGPWIVALSLPLGAIIFLIRRETKAPANQQPRIVLEQPPPV